MLDRTTIHDGPRFDAIEAELCLSQVEALYSDVRSFAIGAIGICIAAFVVGGRTGSALLLELAGALCVIVALRLALMARHGRLAPDERRRQRAKWDLLYTVSSTIHYGTIGAFCFLTYLASKDPLDRTIAFGMVLTYMAGIPGRNFAARRGVDFQIVACAVPLVATMMVAGDHLSLTIPLLLLPYFAALKGLAERLRGIFVQATVKAHNLDVMATRFDAALSNMSHGLAMFNKGGALTVYNRRLLQLLSLEEGIDYHGISFTSLLMSATDAQGVLGAFYAYSRVLPMKAVEVGMRNDTILEFTFQSMEEGGAVALVQDITEKKRAAARIKQLALYDELTGLNNRANFRNILAKRLVGSRTDETLALLFIDLDHFKQVNDTRGHASGDALIRCVADRLREFAQNDVVARVGGDEFLVLHEFSGDLAKLKGFASDLIHHVSQPYVVSGHNITIGASVGLAIFPDHERDPEQLLKKADLALYRAKADGRGSCRVFEPTMAVRAIARAELEADLRQALRNEEFELHYQPIFNLAEQRFSICEALIRWRHPTRGLLCPGDFISTVEEMGLIVDIGKWVLRRACLDCAAWPDDVSVAVNISPLQFRRGDIVTSVSDALANAGLEPERLELELTESVLLQDVAFTTLTMRLLHMRNVTITLDDFGTGYSSLSYMNELPLSKVKIDRSFLNGLETNRKAQLMLRGLTRLSNELGLTVVIEGVETESQMELITTTMDVKLIQGFLFSRPLPQSELQSALRRAGTQRPRGQKASRHHA